MTARIGWLTKAKRKKGDVWMYHFYTTRDTDGKRVENTRTIGLVSKFPRESQAWDEVERTRRNTDQQLSGRLTVSQIAASYRKVELPQKANSTQTLHNHVLDSYILPRWGKSYVDEVRVLEIKQWLMATAKENDLSNVTIQKIKQIFGRLYNYGSENELTPLGVNPVQSVNVKKIGHKSRSKAIVISPEIAREIAMSLPIQGRTLVLLAAATGMRISELLGLKWGDVDFINRRLNLNRTWLYGKEGEGKSEASRRPVELGTRMTSILCDWHRESPYSKDEDWVFASFKLKGEKPISGSQFVKDYVRPKFIEYGLIGEDYEGRAGLHAFRHSLATVLITEQGVDPKTAQGILRHATSSITMDIYTHSQEGAKRAALDGFESRLV